MLDRLTLDQLRVLVAVAETGSFSAAARRLGRVQSAVSQSAKLLEDTLDLSLFERSGRSAELTDAGKIIVEDARNVIRGIDTVRARARNIAGGLEAKLTLVIDGMIPNGILMESLSNLSREFPQLPVVLFTEGDKHASQYLREGSVGLAIYPFDLTEDTEGLIKEFVGKILMIPVVASHHPLATIEDALSPEQRAPYTQLRLTGRGNRGPINSPNQWHFGSQTSRLEFLLEGFGWCFMPLHQVKDHIAAGRIKPLKLQDTANHLLHMYAVYPQSRPLGLAGRWVVADMRKRLMQESDMS